MQVEGDPELVQRRIIEGPLDVHPGQNSIVVHYQMEALVLSEFGEPMVGELKDCKKIISVKGLSSDTDIQSLALHVVASCGLIQPSRVPEVEQLLVYLRTRKLTKSGFEDKDMLQDSTKKMEKQMDDLEVSDEKASILDLDSYLESLYEDLPAKIRGTGLVLQLARSPDNLLELSRNEYLFLALTRVLREEWKKSIELSTNIIYIFFCFSTFSEFHTQLTKHKIGSACMTVLDHEVRRYRSLQEDLRQRRKDSRCLEPGATSAVAKKDYDKTRKKYQQLLKKQDTLLRVTLYLLLNLAENTLVEQKMRNKGLIPHLVSLLERDNQELLILVVSFLKKLSIFLENKNVMAAEGVMRKLVKLIPCDSEILVNVTLRLLLNLSFDPELRQEIIKIGLLPKLVTLLSEDSHQRVVQCILYHISTDQKSRPMFAYTDCVQLVMKMILESPDELLEPELIALGVNLAWSARNAQIMCKGPGLKLLMRRALKTQDSLLMKMIRNVSQHPGPTKKLFVGFLADLGQVIRTCEDEEFVVEVLGILGNLNIPEIDFEKVVRELDLLSFLLSKLQNPAVKDDILLEVIIVCGTFAVDEKCAAVLIQSGVPSILIAVLKAKQEDDELVFQIVYVFYQMVLHEFSRQYLANESQAPDYFLELMNDKNREVSKLCSKVLDILAKYNQDLKSKLQRERFEWHNFQWLEMMTGKTLYEDEEVDEDYFDPSYLHMAAELYDNPDLFHELQSQLESTHGSVPMPSMPVPPPMDQFSNMEMALSGANSNNNGDNPILTSDNLLGDYATSMLPTSPGAVGPLSPQLQGGLSHYDAIAYGGDTAEFEDHPAFAMMNIANSASSSWRPPTRGGGH